MKSEIREYHQKLSTDDRILCERLYELILECLPEAEQKIWHAHPVWFLEGNPVVGYHRLKDGLRLLFWSGQSFDEPGLKPEGKFKAAEIRYQNIAQVQEQDIRRWLNNARVIQWDYKNIVKRKGVLERIR
jgi:hypothetical protein